MTVKIPSPAILHLMYLRKISNDREHNFGVSHIFCHWAPSLPLGIHLTPHRGPPLLLQQGGFRALVGRLEHLTLRAPLLDLLLQHRLRQGEAVDGLCPLPGRRLRLLLLLRAAGCQSKAVPQGKAGEDRADGVVVRGGGQHRTNTQNMRDKKRLDTNAFFAFTKQSTAKQTQRTH